MTYTLYQYVHCPFCVRVRMALGYLGLAYKSVVLAYDDEATPIGLTGKKILPALAHPGGAMNESLDIISFCDVQKKLDVSALTESPDYKNFETLLSSIGSLVHSLAMPYWMQTPEFTPSAREYFQKKKEQKRGPFKDLVKNQSKFTDELSSYLQKLEQNLHPFYQSSTLTLKDIMLAAHLWGLYVVPEYQFYPKLHNWLQSVKDQCHFNYHEDFWR